LDAIGGTHRARRTAAWVESFGHANIDIAN
jgi:hypothetical protein